MVLLKANCTLTIYIYLSYLSSLKSCGSVYGTNVYVLLIGENKTKKEKKKKREKSMEFLLLPFLFVHFFLFNYYLCGSFSLM